MQRRSFIQAAAPRATLGVPSVLAQDWPTARCASSWAFRRAAAPMRWRAWSRRSCTVMWNQQVIVENKAGVGGRAGGRVRRHAAERRQHAADGAHQQPCAGAEPAAQAALQRRARLRADRAGRRDAQPADREPTHKPPSVKDIVALCKAQPGKVSFGSAGAGSAQHLALEMFKLQAKVDALHVPYKGSGPLLTDLMGGQIHYSFETMTAATPHVKSGKVIASRRRGQARQGPPDIPTMQEQGFDGFEATTWYGLAGPGKLPTADRPEDQPQTSTPCSRCPTCRNGSTPTAPRTAAAAREVRQFIASEIAKWSKVVKDGNVKTAQPAQPPSRPPIRRRTAGSPRGGAPHPASAAPPPSRAPDRARRCGRRLRT